MLKVLAFLQGDRLVERDLDQVPAQSLGSGSILAALKLEQCPPLVQAIARHRPRYRLLILHAEEHPLQPAKAVGIVGQDLNLQLATQSVGANDLAHRQVTGLRGASLLP